MANDDESASEVKILPVALKQGMPAKALNGLYGLEETLMASPGSEITAIVTIGLKDIDHKELAGTRRPTVELRHIEPILDTNAIVETLALRDEAQRERVSKDELDGARD